MELTHQGNEIAYPFAWEYVNKVLVPVYEVKVDGVPIAKVWKNDIDHSRAEYQKEVPLVVKSVNQAGDILVIALPEQYTVARMIVEFNPDQDCSELHSGTVETSPDRINWNLEPEKLTDQQIVSYPTLEKGKIHYIFPARMLQYIRIDTGDKNSCLFNGTKANIGGF